ncbi:LutC/YkgG family protein [Desmospora profundinema]|uniref:L-lactate dehydrogenase complex protein LldG n=1 Tax=Desmospora profundinema TaxID=1571184 RepID=A0ABU1INB4_9BACL|nr:lactate utilization protein C [Desmospora profundinema]MDR6226279.1 L-lactate dehydrogenase complex protein LldG [Desmospora profundinema]
MNDKLSKKDAFLERISQRLGRPRPDTVEAPEWPDQPWDELKEGGLEQFAANLEQAGADVIQVPHRQALSERLHHDMRQQRVKRLVAWNDPVLSPLLEGAPLEQVDRWDPSHPDKSIRSAEQADVGLVRAEWGLAFSGTVMLWNDKGRGRSVSLLPAALWVILPASRILPRMEPALSWIREQGCPPSCINFISGPSRTSDIENDLSIGVHGPGELRVYVVDAMKG